MTARYREFLRLPGAARLLVGSLAGRLPLGMSSLAVLLLVHLKTGSFATAGVAVGAYTLSSAITTPLQGRLVDRIGGPPVLIGFAVAQAAGMVAAAMIALGGRHRLATAVARGRSQPLAAAVNS